MPDVVDISFIEKFLAEGRKYVSKGDSVQASEKLYKAVEECIKSLAERHRIPEYEKAGQDGRWSTPLLLKAARRLADNLKKKEIRDAWLRAFEIHVWGFHECKLEVKEIKEDIPYVEWLVNYVKNQAGGNQDD